MKLLPKMIPPLVTIFAGTVLLLMMVAGEGEPGGLPLILIALGVLWFMIIRRPSRNGKSGHTTL